MHGAIFKVVRTGPKLWCVYNGAMLEPSVLSVVVRAAAMIQQSPGLRMLEVGS